MTISETNEPLHDDLYTKITDSPHLTISHFVISVLGVFSLLDVLKYLLLERVERGLILHKGLQQQPQAPV
jgi:hypothetical protein